jgi:hypothetical protein
MSFENKKRQTRTTGAIPPTGHQKEVLMPQVFKAYIVIEDQQGGGGSPPGIWGGAGSLPPWVMPPIAPGGGGGGSPPGIWGPTDPRPTHPIVIPPPTQPGQPPEIWPKPGHPAHPIVIPPDAVSPGVPTHPIYLPPVIWPPQPGHPAHPIYPGGPYPDQGLPGGQPTPGWPPVAMPPIYIPLPPGEELPPDGNGNAPTHPIVLPPDTPPDPNGQYVLVHAYIPGYGGCWFLVNTAHVGGQPPQPGPKK